MVETVNLYDPSEVATELRRLRQELHAERAAGVVSVGMATKYEDLLERTVPFLKTASRGSDLNGRAKTLLNEIQAVLLER